MRKVIIARQGFSSELSPVFAFEELNNIINDKKTIITSKMRGYLAASGIKP